MLGHKRLEMTMQYVHIADSETYKAATLMAETLTDMLENNDILEEKAPSTSPPSVHRPVQPNRDHDPI